MISTPTSHIQVGRTARLSVVIPVRNEAAGLEATLDELDRALGTIERLEAEILVVDDGSTDATGDLVRRRCAARHDLGLLRLEPHQGKEAAIQAGLEHATGDGVVVMDGDLQHPPELIGSMVALWRRGMPVVEAVKQPAGATRGNPPSAARGFFGIFARASGLDIAGHTDFKLLDRAVVDAYLALPERRRFFRGLISWLGYPTARIPFEVPPRRHGRRRFGTVKRIRLSVEALTSFSSTPLQAITGLGALAILLALVFGTIALAQKLTGRAVDGFTTVILIQLILGGLTMIGLGLVGLYLARIFDEVKGRPSYRLDRAASSWPRSAGSPPTAAD